MNNNLYDPDLDYLEAFLDRMMSIYWTGQFDDINEDGWDDTDD